MWVLNCVYEQDFLGFSYGPFSGRYWGLVALSMRRLMR